MTISAIRNCCFAILVLLTAPWSQAQSLVNVSYPGASATSPLAINNNGVVVGLYVLPDGSTHAFSLTKGTFANIDVPFATSVIDWANGINDSGDIVGVFYDSTVHHDRGWLLRGGVYTAIDYPAATLTTTTGISNAGVIVGQYSTASGSGSFLWTAGTITPLNCTCGTTTLTSINNSGMIAGYYVNGTGTHGLEYSSGKFVTLDYPGTADTYFTSINDTGTLAGWFYDYSNSVYRGFKYAAGQYSAIEIPPAPYNSVVYLAVNNSGQTVGARYNLNTAVRGNGFFLPIGPFAYVGSSVGVNVYDTSTNLLVATIAVSGGVTQLTPSPDGSVVYGTSFYGGTVIFIDTKSNTVTATIPAGYTPIGAAVTPDGSTLYIANFDGNSVTVINTASKSVIATIPSPTTGPTNLVITPDGKTVYVNHDPNNPAGSPNAITVIDTATNKVTGSIGGVGTFGFGIAISPDGKTLYVASDTAVGLQYIDIATSTVTHTVSVPAWYISISPDGSRAYVGGYGLGNTAIVDLNSQTVVASVPVGTFPWQSAVTPDGAFVWQANSNGTTSTSIISTASNTIALSLPVTNLLDSGGVAIPSVPAASQSITQPLSPTAPNVFNFGPHNFTVQYPPGTSFSGVNMTVVAVEANQRTFKQRVAGTSFANATCIVYSGAGGNCVDYQVTCSTLSGSAISCPSVSSPNISVKTSFDTLQQIINPGFLTTPIGTNDWTNIFDSFYLMRIDPTMKGRTSGFSEFYAVDLGATNGQGVGTFSFQAPLLQSDTRIFPVGTAIPVTFQLTSVAHPGVPVTDAMAGITVVMLSDANGNSTSNIIFQQAAAFTYKGSGYTYSLNTTGYAPGVYNITVYGNAFAAPQVQFTLPSAASGAHLVTTVQSLTLNSATNQYVAVLNIANSGTGAANGLIVTASQLNVIPTSTALPISLGGIGPGGATTVTLSFPTSAGAAGSRGVLTISESFAGGSGGGGSRVTLP